MPRSTRPRASLADLEIFRADWAELGPEFMACWGRPDASFEPEHLTVYGKSGGGKTYFVGYILSQRALVRRSHIVIVATKRTDKTLMRLGWPIITTWPPSYGQHQVIYWARARGITAEHRLPQRKKVADLMNKLWVPDSNIVVYWDELPYIETDLGLKTQIATFYREGRALGITNVASMQRPSNVTRFAHSEAGWTVAFPPKDADDRDRVAEVLGDRARFRLALDLLDRQRHEFLLRDDRTGEAWVSHLPPPRRTAVRSR